MKLMQNVVDHTAPIKEDKDNDEVTEVTLKLTGRNMASETW